MKLSPLQLAKYLMPEISCAANPDFDAQRPADICDGSFKVLATVVPMKSKSPKDYSSWSVNLDLSQQPDEKANVPYHFSVKLVGLFRCSAAPANVAAEVFVKTNGSSVLYGIAREFLRSLTAVGPWGDLLLPTVSFCPDDVLTEPAPPKKKPRKALR